MTDRAPLTPPECDLRSLPGTVIMWQAVFDSDLWAMSTGDEFKAAFALWGKAWFQQPAGSLPNNERVLAVLAGVGHSEWPRLREMALHNWVLCSDGRLYHEEVAKRCLEAWITRLGYMKTSAAGNAAKHKLTFDATPFDLAIKHAKEMLADLKPERDKLPTGRKKSPVGTSEPPVGRVEAPRREAVAATVATPEGDFSRREPDFLPTGAVEPPVGAVFRSEQELELEPEGRSSGTKVPSLYRASESDQVAEEFARFWAAYPNKVGKSGRGGADGAFRAARKGADWPGIDDIIDAIEWSKLHHPKWLAGYVPNPTTWLNQSRWLDQPSPGPAQVGGRQQWSALQQAVDGIELEHEGDYR